MFHGDVVMDQLAARGHSHIEFTEADLTSSDALTKGSAKRETVTLYK
jgi:hypothetical protein